MTSKSFASVAADSNVVLSAAVGRAACRVFEAPDILIVTTDQNLAEVHEYLPYFIEKSELPEEVVIENLRRFPLLVLGPENYESHVEEARRLIGARDPDDVALLALALARKIPIWSNDKDFENAKATVHVYPTAVLLKILGV